MTEDDLRQIERGLEDVSFYGHYPDLEETLRELIAAVRLLTDDNERWRAKADALGRALDEWRTC